MFRDNRIPLWMPIGALALALLAVGWLRTPRAEPGARAPGASAASAVPRQTPDENARPDRALELPAAAPTERAPVARAEADETHPPVVLLHGRLRDASGAPLPDVRLTLLDAAGKSASVNQSGGSYLTGGLSPGRWSASLSGKGITPLQETLELAVEPAIVEHDFVAEVRRRVPVALRTPSGTELFSELQERKIDFRATMRLSLIATREPSPGRIRPSGLSRLPGNSCGVFEPSDAGGRTPAPEGCCGTFEFRAPAPLWVHVVLGHEPVASVRLDEIPERLEIVVDPDRVDAACGSVTLRPIDAATGAALPEAFATYGTLQMGGQMGKVDGQLLVRGLSPGAYYIRLGAKGHCGVAREFVLGAGQALDLGDVPMPPTRPLKLHLVDTAGKPQELLLTLYALVPGDPRATRGRFQSSMRQKSDAQGIVDLSSIAPGKWVVLVDRMPAPGSERSERALGARPWILDADCTDCPESTLVLEPLAELVLRPKSAAAIGLQYWIDTPDGLPASASSIYDAEPRRVQLAPGPYTLTVEDPDGVELERRSIDLGAAPLEVPLPR